MPHTWISGGGASRYLQEATQESKNLCCTGYNFHAAAAHKAVAKAEKKKKERIWPHSHATGMRCEKPPPLQHIWPWITESVHWWWGRARNRAVAAHRACTHKIWKSAAFSRKIGRTQSLGLLFSNLQKNILRKKVISEKCCRRVSGGACAFSVLWLLCVVYTLLSCWKMVLECTCCNF